MSRLTRIPRLIAGHERGAVRHGANNLLRRLDVRNTRNLLIETELFRDSFGLLRD